MIYLVIFALGFGYLLGYSWGNTKRGKLVKYTNELPDGLMRVISLDKVSAVVEKIGVKKQRFLVSTLVFGGKPIRPKDIVRKIKSEKERIALEISVLGYPPLVRDTL
jgi:hypothetical protein